MTTDVEWEKWGRQDPYFSVITAERFRANQMDAAARAEFFASGQRHMEYVMQSCRTYFGPTFTPRRVLDFGCGVGRVLVHFAVTAEHVVGVDVSAAMLAEAARNCAARGLVNVHLVPSDDDLSQVPGSFDLVHSAITLQHIEVHRGRLLFKRLMSLVAPNGVLAIHLTYAKSYHPDTFGQPPAPVVSGTAKRPGGTLAGLLRSGARGGGSGRGVFNAPPTGDPEMLMVPYDLNQIAFLMQTAGIQRFHAEFTDHGGELGVFLYSLKPVIA